MSAFGCLSHELCKSDQDKNFPNAYLIINTITAFPETMSYKKKKAYYFF